MAPRLPLDPSRFPPQLHKGVICLFQNKYQIPKIFKLYEAQSHFRAHHNPNKENNHNKLVIYVDQLEGGLYFPINPFIKDFFRAYGIALGQLHPNGYRFLTAFCELVLL